ncbi:hypothetical protein FA048_15715 [Pedobacter polaris]|uniref:Lipoprotein n=1 Tax=Pedobacter polaris TaxID=2571273 RepID=A0A4U1CHA3_9SPHI|nr:hypothetical protein [Pedobacter polaris]TKC06651.1 hypothetical protein FA048_15715 [Pedobacter polaris]
MQKLIISLLLLISIFACTDTKKRSNANNADQVAAGESRSVMTAPKVRLDKGTKKIYEDGPNGSNENSGDSIAFGKYAVEIDRVKEKAQLDFNSNPDAIHFKSRITDGYKTSDINFAGHYIAIAFGCGGGCIMGFIVNAKDGKIYYAPLGEENMCVWTVEMNTYKPGSRLYISSVCKDQSDSKDVFYKAYVWNEKEKVFKKEDSRNFIAVKANH